jgi:hypothetical protein
MMVSSRWINDVDALPPEIQVGRAATRRPRVRPPSLAFGSLYRRRVLGHGRRLNGVSSFKIVWSNDCAGQLIQVWSNGCAGQLIQVWSNSEACGRWRPR